MFTGDPRDVCDTEKKSGQCIDSPSHIDFETFTGNSLQYEDGERPRRHVRFIASRASLLKTHALRTKRMATPATAKGTSIANRW